MSEQYVKRGWYATGSTWETWLTDDPSSSPPSGHTLTDVHYFTWVLDPGDSGENIQAAHAASAIVPVVTAFGAVLSSADNTVQKALDTIDDHTHAAPAASAIVPVVTNFSGVLSSSDNTVQKALDTLDDHGHVTSSIAGTGSPANCDLLCDVTWKAGSTRVSQSKIVRVTADATNYTIVTGYTLPSSTTARLRITLVARSSAPASYRGELMADITKGSGSDATIEQQTLTTEYGSVVSSPAVAITSAGVVTVTCTTTSGVVIVCALESIEAG